MTAAAIYARKSTDQARPDDKSESVDLAVLGPMTTTLGAALEVFILEHEYCGELDAGVEDDGVWMTCACGAGINRALEPTGLGKEGSHGR